MKEPPVQLDLPDNPWLELRRLTPARIALGRTGTQDRCGHADRSDGQQAGGATDG